MKSVAKNLYIIDPIVRQAEQIFKKAKLDALERGCTIVTLEGSSLYQIAKNGSRKKLKELEEAFIDIPKGARLSLK